MQQPNNRQIQRNRGSIQKFLPWAIIGIFILIVLGAAIIHSLTNRNPGPPRPVGELRLPKVNVIVQSNVGGAEVYVNGQPMGLTSDTHYNVMLFNLAPKTYQITVKKQGYVDRTESVEVTGKAISQTVQIDLQPNGMEKLKTRKRENEKTN